jgi:exosortase
MHPANLKTKESDHRALALVVAVAGVVWGGMIVKLSTDWSTNPQYEFGYFVPFFIVYLLIRRWPSRPEVPSTRSRSIAVYIALSLLLLLLLPIRVVQEANPDWRPLNWVHAATVVALSLVPIALVGGLGWIRHFGFPFVLIFLALPWPLATEQAVIQKLTGAVTNVTVELLNLMDLPALKRGNVIELAAGSVGVADACSGIRSLAGTLMASVFFGEFYRLTAAKRLLLVASGGGVAFALNLCRTLFLSWRAATGGIDSIEKWHDPAGLTIFLTSFAGLWLIATMMGGRHSVQDMSASPVALSASFRSGVLGCVLGWVIGVEAACELWYRVREGKSPPAAAWDIRWPDESRAFRFAEVPEEVRSILRYTSGRSAIFDWSDGSLWQVFFFRWGPGRSSVQLATMHRPEICLPAVGYRFVAEAEATELQVSGVELPFSGSIFDCDGGRVYVYRCLWEDRRVTGVARNRNFDMSVGGRLTGAWYGRRNLGQRLLQIAIVGAGSEQEARAELRQRLSGLITFKS